MKIQNGIMVSQEEYSGHNVDLAIEVEIPQAFVIIRETDEGYKQFGYKQVSSDEFAMFLNGRPYDAVSAEEAADDYTTCCMLMERNAIDADRNFVVAGMTYLADFNPESNWTRTMSVVQSKADEPDTPVKVTIRDCVTVPDEFVFSEGSEQKGYLCLDDNSYAFFLDGELQKRLTEQEVAIVSRTVNKLLNAELDPQYEKRFFYEDGTTFHDFAADKAAKKETDIDKE